MGNSMRNTFSRDEEITEHIRREVRFLAGSPGSGEDLVNAIVDVMVQANVRLETVSLDDMKRLVGDALRTRKRLREYLPRATTAT
jgi:pantothenate kinase-related protein Tda10